MYPSPPEIAEPQRRKRLGFRMEIDGLREGVKSEWRLTRWEGLRAEVMAASTSSLVTPIASSPPLRRRCAQVVRRIGKQEDDLALASASLFIFYSFWFPEIIPAEHSCNILLFLREP